MVYDTIRRTAQRVTVAGMASRVESIEADLLVFVSSRMDEELAASWEIARQTIDGMDVGRPMGVRMHPREFGDCNRRLSAEC